LLIKFRESEAIREIQKNIKSHENFGQYGTFISKIAKRRLFSRLLIFYAEKVTLLLSWEYVAF
jgi:hypothetical protein